MKSATEPQPFYQLFEIGLQPWVHFIPYQFIGPSKTNILKKLKYVLEHGKKKTQHFFPGTSWLLHMTPR